MATKTTSLMTVLVFGLGVFAAASAGAQSSTGPTWADAASQHHQLRYRMMNEMAQEMTRMTEQLSRGDLSAEDNKKMGERLSRMAKMMRFMSGLAARPAHNHAQLQKQMDQMRAQMKDMMGNSQMRPGAR